MKIQLIITVVKLKPEKKKGSFGPEFDPGFNFTTV